MNLSFINISIICIVFCELDYIQNCYASKKYNRYLAHIFNKYGNGGALSFEGLEHLMYNLGLGGLEFNLTHTIDEHHPDGYKIPDLDNDDDNTNSSLFHQKDDINNSENTQKDIIYVNSNNIELKSHNSQSSGSDTIKMQNIEIDDTNNNDNVNFDRPEINENEMSFKEMHDPKHRHPRHHNTNDNTVSDNKCLSPKSLMKLVIDPDDLNRRRLNYKTNPSRGHSISKRYTDEGSDHDQEEEYNEFISSLRISPETFMKLCPALLVQIDQDACAQRIISDEHVNTEGFAYSWIYATVAIFIISCCGLIGIAVVPLIKFAAYNEILNFLVAVAIGTLCGDALMHLLPHALINEHQDKSDNIETSKSSSDHGHNNEPVWLCSCAFFTALFMYSLENLLPLLKGSNDHNHGHGHSHAGHTMQITQQQQQSRKSNSTSTNIDMESNTTKVINLDAKEINTMLNEVKEDKKGTQLTPVAFMVVLGDGLHNLTDGLAIGAAFAMDPVTGMATALAVLCHELPHELGDFALLLQTGLNIRRAIFLNIVSSILSFMGMAIGLCVAGMHSNMVRWIYAGTAGSFLYIAFADLIPEIGRNVENTFRNSILKISGILIGGIIMILIALNEDALRILFE